MTAKILDGKQVAANIRLDLAEQIAQYRARGCRAPGLAVVLLGEDPASKIYVQRKKKDCEQIGIISYAHDLPQQTTEAELLDLIDQLNADAKIDGILIQLPLPPHIDEKKIITRVSPRKDADGFHPYNVGCLVNRLPALRPCTSLGIIKLLAAYKIALRGIKATVVGASNIVGRPALLELLLAGCTVTICHRFTRALEKEVREAELLISGIGKPGIIQSQWIKAGAIVVDVGTCLLPNGKLVGDIDFESAKTRAEWITPVPGGVGPMTRAMLMLNTLSIYQQSFAQSS